jgi:hypothetical protein
MGCSIACRKISVWPSVAQNTQYTKAHGPYGSPSVIKAQRPAPTFLLRGVLFYLPPRLDSGMFQASWLKPQLGTLWE